jgi:hypothetical protein
MRQHRFHPPHEVEDLEVIHHVDRQALVLQIRALGKAVEHLSAGMDEMAAGLPGDSRAAVRAHIDAARWSLRRLW